MKIAYLVTRMDEPGGPQSHVCDLALWLREQGHEPLVMSGFPGKVSDFLEHQGVQYEEITTLQPSCSLKDDIRAFVDIYKALRRHRPDVLSCHSTKAGILGRLAAMCARTPVIFTAHEAPGRLEKFLGWMARYIITVSEHDRQLMLERGMGSAKKIITLHPGVPDRPRIEKASAAGPVRLLMTGKVGPQKDHARLIRALWGCTDLEWTLDLAGSGDDMELRMLAQQLELDGRINFLGERDDVAELLERKTDIFLRIVTYDNLPRCISEAMRAGLPVIATDTGGIREAVQHDETGMLVAAGDDRQLISALRKLISKPGLRAEMGNKGRQRYKNDFTFIAMAQKTLAVYALIGPRR